MSCLLPLGSGQGSAASHKRANCRTRRPTRSRSTTTSVRETVGRSSPGVGVGTVS